MKYSLNRRHFLKTTALAGSAVAFGVPLLLRGQNLNSKLNIAGIGCGGKGSSDLDCCVSENIVALCDADKNYCAGQIQKNPNAKFYQDFRKMFDELGKSIDAVNIATPDHTHAIIAATAMSLGKHVYCQKPLTQTIYEARQLPEMAKRHKIITQMGNQGSAGDGLRRGIEIVQSGILGTIKELHVWSNRPSWPQGMGRPEGGDPVPEGLDWDLWIGPAPMRPYKAGTGKGKRDAGVYNPFNWRGWLDFGTGALGDMACHTVNMPFRALQLGYPTEIEATTIGAINQETYPIGSKIRFQFPSRGKTEYQAPVTLWWYDGGQPKKNDPHHHDGSSKPPRELLTDVEAVRGEVPSSGCLIVGEKGNLFSGDAYGSESFIKLADDKKYLHYKKHPAVEAIPQTVPRNTLKGGGDVQHHLEWINAIKEHKPEQCFSRFEIGAKLTEIMLLGCVAMRVGKKLEWDGPNMRATNAPEAAQFIKRENRAGWAMPA